MWSRLCFFRFFGAITKALRALIVALPLIFPGCARPKYPTSGQHTVVDTVETKDACSVRFKFSGLCLDWRWIERPGEGQFGTMVVKVGRANRFDQTLIPVEDQNGAPTEIRVFADMPSMHHGAPAPTHVERLDTGTYKVSRLYFSMQGQWEIHVERTLGQRAVDEAIVPYESNF